jgi:hypothetical protein
MRSSRRSWSVRLGGLAILLVAGLVGTTLGPAPGARATIDPGSIAGTVTDLADRPLPDVMVSVMVDNGSYLTVKGLDETDASGAYQVEDLAASSVGYLVRFTDPGGAYATEYYDDSVASSFATTPVRVTAHTTTSGVDASLEPAGTISGRLTTVAGAPVTGGQVRLWWHPPSYAIPMGTYVTDQTGHYTIDRVKAGTYYLDFLDPVSGAREFWDDQPGVTTSGMYGPSATATPLVVAVGGSLSGIDAVLGVPAVPTPTVANVVRPRVVGTLRAGHVVRVSRGSWQPTVVTLRYRWYSAGRAIAHATHRRLALSRRYVGKRLTVRVTASAAGHDPAVVWTKRTARIRP